MGWSEKRKRFYVVRTLGERFWAKVNKTDGCWLWTGATDGHGYGHLGPTRTQRGIKAPRLSWQIHRGAVPEGMCVLHNCPGGDNRLCVNPDHLWLGTKADNMIDMAAKGRSTRGRPWRRRQA